MIVAANTIHSKKAPRPQLKDGIKVLQITDLHLLSDPRRLLLGLNTDKTFLDVLELAKSKDWPPDYILLSGDLAQEPVVETYLRLRHHLERLNIPCLCLPGNHDNSEVMGNILQGPYIHFMERIVTGQWQIIPLDSQIRGEEGGFISSGEIKKLCRFLEEYPEKHALIALHHHPIPCQSEWMDTMIIKNWKKLFAVLDDYKQTETLICGHIHQEMDNRYAQLRILGCPSTCFQFKENSEKFEIALSSPGYRWLELSSDGTINTGVQRLSGNPQNLDLAASKY